MSGGYPALLLPAFLVNGARVSERDYFLEEYCIRSGEKIRQYPGSIVCAPIGALPEESATSSADKSASDDISSHIFPRGVDISES
jgi:hypothetical protein